MPSRHQAPQAPVIAADTKRKVSACDQCGVTLAEDDTCPKCRVYHGAPCEACGRRGFHDLVCPELRRGLERLGRCGPSAVADLKKRVKALEERGSTER
jgi:hypothetical protein